MEHNEESESMTASEAMDLLADMSAEEKQKLCKMLQESTSASEDTMTDDGVEV